VSPERAAELMKLVESLEGQWLFVYGRKSKRWESLNSLKRLIDSQLRSYSYSASNPFRECFGQRKESCNESRTPKL
jgi:hypothetical protein